MTGNEDSLQIPFDLNNILVMVQMRSMDTTADAERVQFEIFRKMPPSKRLLCARRLTQSVRNLLAQGVRSRHPEYNEEQVRLAVIRLILPESLFMAVYPHAADIAS